MSNFVLLSNKSLRVYMKSDPWPVLLLVVSLILSLSLGILYAVPKIQNEQSKPSEEAMCASSCRLQLTEDFPENLPFDYSKLTNVNTYTIYKDMFGGAKKKILIMDSSSNLRALEYTEEYRKVYAKRGNEIFDLLKRRGLKDKIEIKLVDVGGEVDHVKFRDAQELHDLGALERRVHDTDPMVIQHSKALIVDDVHSLITSANLDYLSLQQKGELGVLIKDCPCFAKDLTQIYENMWQSAGGSLVVYEDRKPYNHNNRLRIGNVEVHTAISPDVMREKGRDSELGEIIRLIDEAEVTVDISVMDFVPFFHFSDTDSTMDDITEAVRRAVERNVHVRLLTMSRHLNLRNETIGYLRQLQNFGSNMEIKLLSFPYENVYMDRKSHGKSVVTEKEALISTSNFTPDYFRSDTGLSVILKESKTDTIRQNLNTILSRFWDGPYSYTLDTYIDTCLPVSKDVNICDAINSPHADTLRK